MRVIVHGSQCVYAKEFQAFDYGSHGGLPSSSSSSSSFSSASAASSPHCSSSNGVSSNAFGVCNGGGGDSSGSTSGSGVSTMAIGSRGGFGRNQSELPPPPPAGALTHIWAIATAVLALGLRLLLLPYYAVSCCAARCRRLVSMDPTRLWRRWWRVHHSAHYAGNAAAGTPAPAPSRLVRSTHPSAAIGSAAAASPPSTTSPTTLTAPASSLRAQAAGTAASAVIGAATTASSPSPRGANADSSRPIGAPAGVESSSTNSSGNNGGSGSPAGVGSGGGSGGGGGVFCCNESRYGASGPPSYRPDYWLLDVPVHFVAGGKDVLIPVANVEEQHALICLIHGPGASTLRTMDDAGHLDFTLTLSDELIRHVLQQLECGGSSDSLANSARGAKASAAASSALSTPPTPYADVLVEHDDAPCDPIGGSGASEGRGGGSISSALDADPDSPAADTLHHVCSSDRNEVGGSGPPTQTTTAAHLSLSRHAALHVTPAMSVISDPAVAAQLRGFAEEARVRATRAALVAAAAGLVVAEGSTAAPATTVAQSSTTPPRTLVAAKAAATAAAASVSAAAGAESHSSAATAVPIAWRPFWSQARQFPWLAGFTKLALVAEGLDAEARDMGLAP